MQAKAAQVCYSETVFAARSGDGWRVRYFAPEIEVPFCGHATIALGAALALAKGDGAYSLQLNDTETTVDGRRIGAGLSAALQSPGTRNEPADDALIARTLSLFSYDPDDLDVRLPPAVADAGARHLILALRSRSLLSQLTYELEAGRSLMNDYDLITISLICQNSQYPPCPQPFFIQRGS